MAKTLVLLRKSATLGDVIKQEVALAKHTNRVRPCPHCGSTETGIMPPDFETAKCADCGRLFPPHTVGKAVEHQAAGTTTTNPDTGKTIHGGQFTVSHGGGSFDIAKLTTWSAPKRVMAQGVPKDLSTGPQPANWWDLWGNPTVKDQLRAAGVSPGKDQNGRWVLNWWRTPSEADQKAARKEVAEADQKAARKEVAGANKRLEMSSALDSKLVVPKGPNVPAGQDFHPFQRAGIEYAKDLDAALIADEMGLGKTMQAIGVANLDKKCRKVLVVVPSSLRPNWRKEWRKWGSNGLTVGTFDTGAAHLPSTDVVIINYDNLAKMRGEIDKRKWDMLVVDEVHFAKGDPKDVQRSAALWGGTNATLGKMEPIQAKRKLFLTGTPVVNRPRELWNLVHALDPEGLGKNFFKFALRYCDGKQISIGRGRTAWDFGGHSNLEELQQKLRSTFMRRVLKKDAWVGQPTKMRQLVPIEPGAEAKKALARMAEDFAKTKAGHAKAKLDALEAAGKQNTAAYASAVDELMDNTTPAFESMSTDRRDLALAKVDDVASFAKDMLESQDKVVIFCHHREVVDKLVTALKAYKPVKIYGGMGDTQKDNSVSSFQEDPSCRVLVANIKAGGVGYTLTASDTLIFAEQDWSPGNMQQAEDRIHRLGQESPFVNYYTLVYDDSLDSYMAKMVQRKAAVIKRAVDRSPGDAVKPLAMPAKQVAAPTTVVLPPSLAVDKPKPTAAPSGAGAGANIPVPTPVTVKVVTPKFSPGQIAELRRHIDTLMRNSPDGVSTRNDVGFSGATLEPGRDLAYNSNWSTRDAEMAARIVRNHSKQVEAEWDEHGRIMAPDMPPWEENIAPGSGAAASAYLGKVRERHAMNGLTLQSMRPIYGDYGTSYAYTFKDADGRLVEAKVSNPIGNAHHDGDLQDGETVNLEGFVTEHGSQYRTNIPVTKVNRVKVSATPFLPSTPKPAKKVAIRKAIDLTPEMQRVIESRDSIHADPSDAQKEAGNYRMGHVRIHGLDISIETPKGGTRSGVGPDGKPWSVKMSHDYGYVRSVD